MTQRFSPVTWMIWTIACAFLVLVTRNPVYLAILLIAVLFVYLSLEQRTSIALAWGVVLRIGLIIAAISVAFNVLTVHAGDRQFGSLPSSWPVVGGALTWNAVVYGLISGAALLTLLLIAATLSTAVERAALVRMVPASLGVVGISAAAALSIFPQTILAIGQVREAHRARGVRIRSIRDLQRLIVPVLNIGLERAFQLAESMESRAYGNRAAGPGLPNWLSLSALFTATIGVVLFGIGQSLTGISLLVASLIAVAAALRWSPRQRISRYRQERTGAADLPVLIASSLIILFTAIEMAAQGNSLGYATYPRIDTPDVSLFLVLGCALASIPATVPGKQSPRESGND